MEPFTSRSIPQRRACFPAEQHAQKSRSEAVFKRENLSVQRAVPQSLPCLPLRAVGACRRGRLRVTLVQISFFRLCPSISTQAKVSHCPKLCHPDRSGPGFPGQEIRGSVGEGPAVSLGLHATADKRSTNRPNSLETHALPYNQRITRAPSPIY
jgi:hypothetical protein